MQTKHKAAFLILAMVGVVTAGFLIVSLEDSSPPDEEYRCPYCETVQACEEREGWQWNHRNDTCVREQPQIQVNQIGGD